MKKQDSSPIHITFISDNNYVIPTCVAITSIIESKDPSTRLCIHVVCASLSDNSKDIFYSFNTDMVEVDIIVQDADRFSRLHKTVKCNASQAALLKFVLPELLPDLDRVLYLDGDILVRGDLTELYNTELKDNYVAAVLNTFTFYRKHSSFEEEVENYFNSGVLVLNLRLMREDNITERLLETKSKLKWVLMDQIAFNIVFDKRVSLLPVRYNYQILSLPKEKVDREIRILNKHFGTRYANLEELRSDAVIVHFAHNNKPWRTLTAPLFEEWYLTYLRIPGREKLPPLSELCENQLATSIDKIKKSRSYRVGRFITWLPRVIYRSLSCLR